MARIANLKEKIEAYKREEKKERKRRLKKASLGERIEHGFVLLALRERFYAERFQRPAYRRLNGSNRSPDSK